MCTNYCYDFLHMLDPHFADQSSVCFNEKLCALINDNYCHQRMRDEECFGEFDNFEIMWNIDLGKRQRTMFFENENKNYFSGRYGPMALENDPLATTHQENVNSSNHGDAFTFNLESRLFQRCFNKAKKSKDQYIECENKQSNYFFVREDWLKGVAPQKYFKQDCFIVVPFSDQEEEIWTKLLSIDRMNNTELIAFWMDVKDTDYHVRCGSHSNRKVFDVASVVKNIIYLRMLRPLVEPEYYEVIKNRLNLYCQKCPKQVSLSCTCDFCEWVRYTDNNTFSNLKEIFGHHEDCPTIKESSLEKSFKSNCRL